MVQYDLQFDPSNLPHPVKQTIISPALLLDTSLNSSPLTADEVVTFTIADRHVELEILPALAYTVPINAAGGGFTENWSVRLLVGGIWVYLLIILRIDLGY